MASSSSAEIIGTDSANSDQLKEVASVKEAFPNRCRVMSDVGEFSKIVTIQPEDMDVTIKFHLPAAYPSVIPEITIRSGSLTEENIADVRQILKSRARKMLGQQMIRLLITQAEAELKVLGLKRGKTTNVTGHTVVDKQRKKIKKHKTRQNADTEDKDEKLPSMKTADDVVKRIIWDDTLEKDDFIVGYCDRFRGLVEKCFSDFSWEDLAAVDYDVLAVPKHRIQYFKYKNVKVWDKTKRVDNVFGSADGTKTIDVVIKELQELERLGQTAADSSLGSSDNNSDEDSITEDDDSDDCEALKEDTSVPITSNSVREKYHLECNPSASPYGTCKQNVQDSTKSHNQNNSRPNHFLCVRITSQEVHDKVGKLQDALIEREPLLSECCIPGAALHLTLSTLGLDTPDQVSQCIETLNKIKPVLESALPTCDLKLLGVSHFRNQVLYAQIVHTKDLHEFCNSLKHLLQEAGVQIRDGYDFTPHVTILKMTRPVTRSLGSKYISPELYRNHKDTHFGGQRITSMSLCCIGKDRREDGFYVSPHELNFTA